MTIRMQQRRDSAANWTGSPVILASGEIGVETDTGRIKVGNGSSIWTALPYSTLSEFKTSAAWGSYASVIALGKICFDSDSPFFKVGDGTSTWSELDYFKPASAILGDVGIDFDTLEEIQDLLLGGTANQVLVTPDPDGTPVWSNTLTDIQSLDFNTAVGTSGLAKIAYDDTLGTLEFGLKGGNVTLHIGQGQVLRVRNNTGSTLAKGTVVYINGSNGTNFNVAKALADSDATSAQTIGVLAEELNTSSTQHGFAMTYGLVTDVDLSYIAGLANGDMLFLDPSTAGRLTKTKPSGPDHLVYMGYCLSAAGGGSNSTIFVKPQNGYELNEIHDVKVSSLANNDILTYDNTTDPTNPVWVNKNSVNVTGDIASTAGNITSSSATAITNTSTAHALQAGPTSGKNVRLGADGTDAAIQAVNNGSYSTLDVNSLGGNVNIGSIGTTTNFPGIVDFTGTIANGNVIAAGTATAGTAPLQFTSGTNLTAAVAGAVEYDGTTFYATPNATSGRAYVPQTHYFALTTARTQATPVSGTAYDLFGQKFTVAASTTYEFEMQLTVSNPGTVANTLNLLFALADGASLTSIGYSAVTTNGTSLSTPNATSASWSTVATAFTVCASVAAATARTVIVKGTMRVNAAGSIRPQYSHTGAPGNTTTIGINSYIKLTPIGSNTVTSIGTWAA